MFKRVLILTLFLSFGWFGISKVANQNLSEEQIQNLIAETQSGNIDTADFGLDDLLIQLAVGYYIPTSEELSANSQSMLQNIQNYCNILSASTAESFKSDDVVAAKSAAQSAWLETMGTYHKIFTAPFGPLYNNTRDIANNLYSWPLMNECGMHVEMVNIKETGAFDPKSLYTSKGLMAVEFGLYKDVETTTCNTRNARFKKVHEWLKNDEFSKSKDMCALAKTAAVDVQAYAAQLAEAWSVSNGNYAKKMVDGSEYESFKFAFNRITDGLFTMIEVAKDVQLGKPLGLHKDCLNPDGKCPEDVEHKWSQTGLEALEKQFEGLGIVLNDGGLGTYLTAQGHEGIYQSLLRLNQIVLDQISEVKKLGTLKEQIQNLNKNDCENTTESNNLVPVCAIQRQTRTLVQTFRSEFFPALVLDAPLVYQGDND